MIASARASVFSLLVGLGLCALAPALYAAPDPNGRRGSGSDGVPGAGLARSRAELEQCLRERFHEKSIPRTDYAVLLSTRFRHALVDLAAGKPGVERTLADILERCRENLPDVRRPLEKLAPEAVPELVDGGDLASLRTGLARSLALLAKARPAIVFGAAKVAKADMVRGVQLLIQRIDGGATPADLARTIRESFDVYRSPGAFGTGEVLFTSYASPVYSGALQQGGPYQHPLYRNPARVGLPTKGFDRAAIYAGKLAGRGLEIAWLTSRMDEYQIQVEGSGFVRLPDGGYLHVTYAGQNGKAYQSLGKALVGDGVLNPWEIDNPAVRRYFHEHPEAERPYLERNASYVFFDSRRIVTLPKRPELTGERSVAADRTYFPPGMLAFADTSVPIYKDDRLTGGTPWRRFILGQDVGGAIKGPGRIDLYQGQGDAAQQLADTMKEPGALYLLLPKGTALLP